MINQKKMNKGIIGVCMLAVYTMLVFRQVAVGVHIDEEVMVAMGYRFLQGDKFFIDNQEPQLLIAPLIGFAEKIWMIVSGSTDGIFIYMKILTYLILLAVSLYVFKVLKEYLSCKQAFFLTLVYHFYHFRYINVIDYTFIFTSASLLCILLWMNYEYSKYKCLNVILGALSFSLMVLCFPTAAVLFPIYLYLYYKKCGSYGMCILAGVCVTAAIVECIILFWGHNLTDIPDLVQSMVAGSPYAKNISDKLKRINVIIIGLFAFIVSDKAPKLNHRLSRVIETPILKGRVYGEVISWLFLMYGFALLFHSTCIRLEYFNKEGYCYILLFGAIQILLYKEYKWLSKLYIWGILCDSLVFFMTRYDTVFIYAFTSLFATMVILIQKIFPGRKGTRWLSSAAFALFMFIQLFSKGILMISNNNHSGDTVFNQSLMQITEGPARGSLARTADVEKQDEIYQWIIENIGKSQKVCYFGKNVLLYLMSPNIEVAVPQMFMDYSNDQVLGGYYNSRNEKIPDIVILDISPTTKRIISDEEMKLFAGYSVCYQSENYKILEK